MSKLLQTATCTRVVRTTSMFWDSPNFTISMQTLAVRLYTTHAVVLQAAVHQLVRFLALGLVKPPAQHFCPIPFCHECTPHRLSLKLASLSLSAGSSSRPCIMTVLDSITGSTKHEQALPLDLSHAKLVIWLVSCGCTSSSFCIVTSY